MYNSQLLYNKYIDLKRLNFISGNLHQYGIPSGGAILDIGCGNGNISIALGLQGYRVTGIDISEKTILKARSLNRLPNVEFMVSSAEELGKTQEKFDAIICSEVLEHLKDPEVILSHVGRLLHSHGLLIVTVPNGRGPREMLVTRPLQKLRKRNGLMWRSINGMKKMLGYNGVTMQTDAEDLEHVQFFTMSKLRDLASQNEFEIVTIGSSNFIEDVFPFSFFTKRIHGLQKLDCRLADILPVSFSGGFNMVWRMKGEKAWFSFHNERMYSSTK